MSELYCAKEAFLNASLARLYDLAFLYKFAAFSKSVQADSQSGFQRNNVFVIL